VVRIGLKLLLKSIGGCFLLLQILLDLLAMREVISNTRVNVAKAERRKAPEERNVRATRHIALLRS